MFCKSQNKCEPLVPIVLHKIILDQVWSWEDVREDTLENIIDIVGDRWAVLGSDLENKNPRWVITFDDGNFSDYEIVFPKLIEKNIKATFFVIIDKIGTPGYLSWLNLLEMHRSGMSFGSHSMSHRPLTSLSIEEAIYELSESKAVLEDALGQPVLSFSYPYGECSSALHQLATKAGYQYIFSSKHGVFDFSSNIVPRNSINSSMNFEEIRDLMNAKKAKLLKWWVEDYVKSILKLAVGKKNYINIRTKMLSQSGNK